MRIKTQFLVTMCVFGLVLIVIAASLLITYLQVDRLGQQEKIAHDIERGASELTYLSSEYLLHRENAERTRWENKFASFSKDVGRLSADTPEQQVLVNSIRANRERVKAVFDGVVAALAGSAQAPDAAAEMAFLKISWSRMQVQSQGMIFDASQLSQKFDEQIDELREMNIVLLVALIGIFGTFFLTSYLLIYRRMLGSLSNLQAGTEIIGSGNLDFALPVKHADEIGQLSHAFNRMATRLREITASKTDLEKEIVERKKAQQSLQEAMQELAEARDALEIRVQERTRELSGANAALQIEIAERCRAEESVMAERQRFNDVLEMLPVYVALLSPDHHVPFANRFFRERFGESHGKRCYEYLFGRSEPCEICESFEVQRTRAPHHWEWTGPDSRYYDISDFIFTDTDGAPLILEVGIDITERKCAEQSLRKAVHDLQEAHALLEVRVEQRTAELAQTNEQLRAEIKERQKVEQALRESEARYRSLFEGISEGFALHEIICDEHGTPVDYLFLEINPAFERLTGLKREQVVGKTMRTVLPNEDLRWVKVYGQVALTCEPVHIEEYSPSLQQHYEVFAYCPAPRQFAVLLLNITERKRAEERIQRLVFELEQQAEQLQQLNTQLEETLAEEQAAREEAQVGRDILESLMQNAPDVIIIADAPDINIRMVSRCAQEKLGRSFQEMLGAPDAAHFLRHAIFQPDGITQMAFEETPLARAVQRGETTVNQEISLCRPDGEKLTFLSSAGPICAKDSKVTGGIAVWRDITERKRAEVEIESLARFPGENPNPIMRLDLNGVILYANDRSEPIRRDSGLSRRQSRA